MLWELSLLLDACAFKTTFVFETQKQVKRERGQAEVCWFTLQLPAEAGPWPGQSQEPGTPPGLPHAWRDLVPPSVCSGTPAWMQASQGHPSHRTTASPSRDFEGDPDSFDGISGIFLTSGHSVMGWPCLFGLFSYLLFSPSLSPPPLSLFFALFF